jgi:hypothetical protein
MLNENEQHPREKKAQKLRQTYGGANIFERIASD